jgi:TolB-like protein
MTRHKFGAFSFEVPGGLLSKDQQNVPLGQRAAALLTLLLEHRGDSVSKAALMDAAWPGLAVEESNLTVQMAALRKVLGAAPSGRDWVQTVPRVGYRFVAADEEQAAAPAVSPYAKPSIAVLPFANLSADTEQDYFALGLADDLITDLSKVQGLTVIARSSSFAYAERTADPAEVAAELGVRYIVEGSVRRSASTVRINAQVVDATTRHEVWADRIDGEVSNVFALQDEVARRIVTALGHVVPATQQRAAGRQVSIQAYELFIRGRALVLDSPEHFALGRSLLERATEIDPQFAEAYGWIAMATIHGHYLWGEPEGDLRAAGIRAARKAIELDAESAAGHAFLGFALLYDGDFVAGEAELARALAIDPNYADAWALNSELKSHSGDHDAAREAIGRAFELNPYPPGWYYWMRGFIEFASGDYESTIRTLSHVSTRRSGSQRILAAALAQVGRLEEARREAAEFLARNPRFSISGWIAGHPSNSAADLDRFAEGYRRAGLPS